MVGAIISIALGAFIISALSTGVVRRLALAYRVMDVPNERSSHSLATPRGGGLAIVAGVTIVAAVMAFDGLLRLDMLAAIVGGGTAVAVVGFLDDRSPLPVWVRFLVHVAAAVWAVFWIGGVPRLGVSSNLVVMGWLVPVLAVLSIVWVLNLFNFMDGIDGLAGSEAVFVASGGALLTFLTGGSNQLTAVATAVSGASCGFLLWNWPPAKVFMGDVGSGYLGYVIAVLALAAGRANPTGIWVWLILGGVFFADATITLLRRLTRGERLYEAHRTHAYQWLARRWGSHRRVTCAVSIMNLFWLFPCARFASACGTYAYAIAVAALIPVVVIACAVGAGRREKPTG
jgi:Fuc2NAc and GlcNAc transferase